MAVKVLELHHHGIRVGPSPEEVAKARRFYGDVLGLDARSGPPDHPDHRRLLDGRGRHRADPPHGRGRPVEVRQGPGPGPVTPHVALAVADIQETKQELERLGVDYWVGRERGGTAVAADLHEGPVRQHDRAAPDRHVPVRDVAALGRTRRQDGVNESRPRPRIVDTAARLARETTRAAGRALRPRGRQPGRQLARPARRGHPRRRDPAAHGGLGLDMPTYVERDPDAGAGLRQHGDDAAHALHRHALHRRARHRGPEAPLLRRGRGRRHGCSARWGSEPAVSLSRTLPDGDGHPRRRRRVRGGRRQALLHHGPGRLVLHGLVRARRRDRHGQGAAAGAGARRRRRASPPTASGTRSACAAPTARR